MKTKKENYTAPRIETIEIQTEECIAASYGNGAAMDAGKTPGIKKETFWKSTNPFVKEE